jgi:hypothetical protein
MKSKLWILPLALLVSPLARAQASDALPPLMRIDWEAQLWTKLEFAKRYETKALQFNIRRALLGASADFTSQWGAKLSVSSDSFDGDAYLNEGVIVGKNLWGGGGSLLFGRIKLPHYSFLERTFDHRWEQLPSFGERYGVLTYRDSGLVLGWDFKVLELALTFRNGYDTQGSITPDDDLAYGLSFYAPLSDLIAVSGTYDFQEEQTTVLERTATMLALHARAGALRSLLEVNWLMLGDNDEPTRNESMNFGLHVDYAIEQEADGTGWGWVGNWGTGDEDYERRQGEAWRVGTGPYFNLHPYLRSSLLLFVYGGLEEVENSDGYWLAWNWEARF